jgi:peptidoglycan L-alanyl-D-glutamate endopeptidase CwlK
LQLLFRQVVREYDCTVLVGHRNERDQTRAFDDGKSRLRWPDSKHNKQPSLAIDIAPYPIDWADTKRFYYFAGYVKGVSESMNIKIRFGGDWDSDLDLNDQTLMDLVHFELA